MDAPVTRAELEERLTSLQHQIEALSGSLQARETTSQPSTSEGWGRTNGTDFSMDTVSTMNTRGVIGPYQDCNITQMERVQADNEKGQS